MISAKLLFASITFCLLWIWLFSSTSQNNNKRSLNVKTNIIEITNSLSNYLVSDQFQNNWFSISKPAENFAGVSFEVIPAMNKDTITIGMYSKSGIGTVFIIQWESQNITLSYKARANNTDKPVENFKTIFKNKFTFEMKLISHVLRVQICSNNKCAWNYVNYQKLGQLKFDNFFISLYTKNSALIRSFKLQKFLVSKNTDKYYPLQRKNNPMYQNFPKLKILEFNAYLEKFNESKSNYYVIEFDTSDTWNYLRIEWKEFPWIMQLIFPVIGNNDTENVLFVPYTNVVRDVLTVRLFPDYEKDLITMETNNQNLTVNATFNNLEKFYPKDVLSKIACVVNSDEGWMNETSISYYPPQTTITLCCSTTAPYMIAFRNISTTLNATIRSFISGYDINVIQNNGMSTIIFNQKTATITHDSSFPKPEVEIILEKYIIYMFTSDGKRTEVESDVSPEFVRNVTLANSDTTWIQVNAIALVK